MRKILFGMFLVALISGTLVFGLNVQPAMAATVQGWQIEGGGQYSESNGIIRLWASGGQWIILYKEFSPISNFNVSLQVNAAYLQGFALELRGSLPFAGSTDGINFEFGARDGGTFSLARYANGWKWNVFVSNTKANVWYTMKLSVYSSPYRITAQAFDDKGAPLGSFTASDMSNFAFGSIRYLGFGVLESGGDFYVRYISRTWTVDDNGPADFHTIREAVNAASVWDIISVKSGTYSEHLTINKTFTLIGENRNTTIIDGGHTEPGSVIVVAASNMKIKGFTIQNARSGGNAIWIDGYVNSTISGNIITNNGDGIRILHSSGNVIGDNIIKNNPYTSLGFDWSHDNLIYNNTITNNYIGIGAGEGAGEASYNNTFSENTISKNSYGFLIAIYDSKFFHNNIINNTVQARFYGSSYANTWDNGYPSGGNYWSDYADKDSYNGLGQNLSGSDGIGDTPYIVDARNRDRYPLMKPWTSLAYTPIPSLSVQVSANPGSITTGRTSIITVTVTSGGSTISGALVSLSSTGGSLNPTSGTTDSNGKFTASFSSSTAGTFTITASASKSGYNPGSANTQVIVSPVYGTTVTVSTDRTSYSPGQLLKVSGTVSPVTAGQAVAIVVNGPSGDMRAIDQVTPNADGTYSKNVITFMQEDPSGTWTVKATYQAATATTTFTFVGGPIGTGTFTPSAPALLDSAGNTISSVARNTGFFVQIQLTSNIGSDLSVYVLAQIKGTSGNAAGIGLTAADVRGGATKSVPVAFLGISTAGTYTATIFVWSSITEPTPYAPTTVLVITVT